MGKRLSLFCTFFKIGAFTFGGGYAMIPIIQREVVEKKKWATDEDILDIIAVAESTPGPIAINAATFIGRKVAGFWGALSATLGVVLPSFVIISLISLVLRQFSSITWIRYAFWGIRAGVLALILKALISMYKKCPKGLLSYIVMALALIGATILGAFGINVIFIILGSALLGLVWTLIAESKNKEDHK